jgi:hypothetical protein
MKAGMQVIVAQSAMANLAIYVCCNLRAVLESSCFFFDNFAANQTKGFRRMHVGSIRRPVESGTDQRLLHRL